MRKHRLLAACLISVATVAVLSVLAATASSAMAHAVLESTTPVQGSQVEELPAAVTLTFGEDVTIDQNSVRVLATDGHRVDTGQVGFRNGNARSIGVDLLPGTPHGSYTVVWRAVSADSHPVAGTFSFGYGVPAGGPSSAAPSGSRLVGFLHGTALFLSYVGFAGALGTAIFVGIVWPELWRRRIARALVGAGLALIAASAAGLFALVGPYNTGSSIGQTLSLIELHKTLDTRIGQLLLLRLGLVVLAALLWFFAQRAPRAEVAVLGAVGGVTFSLSEHAGVGRQYVLATAIDAVHLTAAAVWIGGLAVLFLVVLREGKSEPDSAITAPLLRWSRIAGACVALLVLSGIYQSWREVGTWPAFTETVYGRLVLAKVGILLILLCLGAFGRRWVQAHRDPIFSPPSIATLRRSVGGEAALSMAALAVVALLVNVQPGRDSYNPSVSRSALAQGISSSDQRRVVVEVESTRPGRTEISIALSGLEGYSQGFAEVSGSLMEDEKGLGPVRFTIPASETGRGSVQDVVVPESGRWQLVLQVRIDDTSSYVATTSYLVR